MMDETVKAVELIFKVTGLDKMAPNIAILEKIHKTTGDVSRGSTHMGHALSKAADRSASALERLDRRLEHIGETFSHVLTTATLLGGVMKTVHLGSSQETQVNTLASTLQSFGYVNSVAGGPAAQYAAAQGDALEMIQRMRRQAAVLPGEETDYETALAGMSTALAQSRATENEQADFASQITALGMSKGIHPGTIGHEAAAILQGRPNRQMPLWSQVIEPLLQANGTSDAQFKALNAQKRRERLMEVATGSGAGQMLEAGKHTWAAQEGTFASNITSLFREGGSGVFEDMKQTVEQINELFAASKENMINMVKQGGQFLHVIRPVLPLLIGSHALKSLTGKGIAGWGRSLIEGTEGWGRKGLSAGYGGLTQLGKGGAAAGGWLSRLGGAMGQTAADAGRVGATWGRAAGGAMGRALSSAKGGLSDAVSWVWGRGAASGPAQRLRGLLGHAAAGTQSLRSRAVGALWEGRFQAEQVLGPLLRRARAGIGGVGSTIMGGLTHAKNWGLGGLDTGLSRLRYYVMRPAQRAARSVGSSIADKFWEGREALAPAMAQARALWGRAGGALGRVRGAVMGGLGRAGDFMGGAAALAHRVNPFAGMGGRLAGAGRRMGGWLGSAAGAAGVDIGGLAARASERFKGLGGSLGRAGSLAGSFARKTGGALTKVLPHVGNIVGALAKIGIYAAVIVVLAAGIREIMKSAAAQQKIMGAIDRLLGSFRAFAAYWQESVGDAFGDMKDWLPNIITGLIEAGANLVTNLMAAGMYLGDLAFDMANPSAPRSRHNFDVYQAQARGEVLREAERARHERQGAERAAGGRGNQRGATQNVTQDFRGSHFNIKQEFAPGYDPDRIAVGLTNSVGDSARRRLQSNLGPMFSVR